MASIALMIGGALVNAFAFTGGNYLFSMLRGHDEAGRIEQARHNEAMERQQAAMSAWSKKRMQRLDWINEQFQREKHAVETFRDVDRAMREYHEVFGTRLEDVGPRPQLSDFYTPSETQKDYEIGFIIAGTTGAALLAYKFL